MSNMSNNNYRYNTTYECELLAPAGSTDAFLSAINAGADAVYMGGTMFGARAFADNPDEDALISCINYAHLRGRKVYLTVNTLLKNNEINDTLYNYILPYYKAGLDAVIVQDLGVLRFIKKHFPHLPIHASTQMTIYSKEFAEILKNEGVSRVVTPRELSFKEIKAIKDATNLEIESFVHGALCYCYSGQCLFSSIAGNRSGNRGRCAQPCRMPYSVNNGTPEYILSPKDLCTLDILPDIIESGVYSLKIEGRMKKPEYVSAVVSIYRKYIDYLKNNGRANYKVSKEDKDILNDIYNRGNFTDGYYNKHNGKDMLSLNRPNHTGVNALKILNNSKKETTFTALRDLNRGDVIEFSDNFNITLDKDLKKGATISYKIPRDVLNSNQTVFNRVRNNKLIEELNNKYLKSEFKVSLDAYVMAKLNEPLKITVNYGDIYHSVEGEIVTEALNKPTTDEMIVKMVNKTGNTPFCFNNINVMADENIFINIKDCNELRRRALDEIEKIILSTFTRDDINDFASNVSLTYKTSEEKGENYIDNTDDISNININCMITNAKQFDVCVNHQIHGIYLEMTDFANANKEEICNMIDKAHSNGKNIYLALPYVFRENIIKLIEKSYDKWCFDKFDALLIRSLSEYGYFVNKGLDKFIFDYNVYSYNDYALQVLNEYNPKLITASLELDSSELSKLNSNKLELMVYGNFPLMTSAQCIRKSKDACLMAENLSKNNKSNTRNFTIKDRLGNVFYSKAVCFGCYNLIYNNKPLSLLNRAKEIYNIAPKSIRLSFINESIDEINDILNNFIDVIINKQPVPNNYISDNYTKGHFKRRMD